MPFKYSALVLCLLSSRVSIAADYTNHLDCYRQIVGSLTASPPITFEIKKSHDGVPAGLYIFDKTKSFFCALPANVKEPDLPKNLKLIAGTRSISYTREVWTPGKGTSPDSSFVAKPPPIEPLTITCEDNELPRMTQAFNDEILTQADKFVLGRTAGNKAVVRGQFDAIAKKINTCMQLIPSLGTPLFEVRQRIYKFYNSDQDLEVEVPKSTR